MQLCTSTAPTWSTMLLQSVQTASMLPSSFSLPASLQVLIMLHLSTGGYQVHLLHLHFPPKCFKQAGRFTQKRRKKTWIGKMDSPAYLRAALRGSVE